MDVFAGDVLNAKTASKFSGIDLIVCNPPYLTAKDMKQLQKEVTFEPEMALLAPENGLYFYRILSQRCKDFLVSGGLLAFEVGWTQAKAVAALMEQNGYINIQILQDYGGNDRVVLGYKE